MTTDQLCDGLALAEVGRHTQGGQAAIVELDGQFGLKVDATAVDCGVRHAVDVLIAQ